MGLTKGAQGYFFKLVNFWLQWVFITARGFSSCSEWGATLLQCTGFFLTVVASLVAEQILQHVSLVVAALRLSTCGIQAK